MIDRIKLFQDRAMQELSAWAEAHEVQWSQIPLASTVMVSPTRVSTEPVQDPGLKICMKPTVDRLERPDTISAVTVCIHRMFDTAAVRAVTRDPAFEASASDTQACFNSCIKILYCVPQEATAPSKMSGQEFADLFFDVCVLVIPTSKPVLDAK